MEDDKVEVKTLSERVFWTLTDWPRSSLAFCILLIMLALGFWPFLTTNTSFEAFLPLDSPEIAQLADLEGQFGETSVVAVAVEVPGQILSPPGLELIKWWSTSLAQVPGIDPGGILSLSNFQSISGSDGLLSLEPLIPDGEVSPAEFAAMRSKLIGPTQFLLSEDGHSSLIVARLDPAAHFDQVSTSVLALKDKAPEGASATYFAGDGAITGSIGAYIDKDSRRMVPVGAFLVLFFLYASFRSSFAAYLPTIIAMGAGAVSLGAMAVLGAPIYIITNAMPVLLLGVGVADGVHILTQFYEEAVRTPEESLQSIVVRTMNVMWRPVLSTSISDGVGLLCLGFASDIPPLTDFGFYTTLGVVTALLLSLVGVPAALMLKDPRANAHAQVSRSSWLTEGMVILGRWVLAWPKLIVAISLLLIGSSLLSASFLRVDDARISAFHDDAPVAMAERFINEQFGGSYRLDLVFSSSEDEALSQLESLQAIKKIQEKAEDLPNVGWTASIVDFVEGLNGVLGAGEGAAGLPKSQGEVSELLFLHSLASDGEELGPWVDESWQKADVQIVLNSGFYSDSVRVVEGLESFIPALLEGTSLDWQLTGPVMVDVAWIRQLGRNHFIGLGLALFSIGVMASLAFSSVVAGLCCLMPVAAAVALVYGVMAYFEVFLGVGTSMFAAIAIGFGVDFSIHTLERLRKELHDGQDMAGAFASLYPSTGRALLVSLLALLLTFVIMTFSEVPALTLFGWMGALAVFSGFIFSMTTLPALLLLLKPKFLFARSSEVSSK